MKICLVLWMHVRVAGRKIILIIQIMDFNKYNSIKKDSFIHVAMSAFMKPEYLIMLKGNERSFSQSRRYGGVGRGERLTSKYTRIQIKG